ncbi:transport protein [Lactobacillus phage LJ]|uniref:Transport protein n=1 Tax=Lactobacillus phage LJ TaxID=2041454 RepID=A0A2D1GPC7_9CAUD|nr:transport protein [Lactobacillus phage LJ]ATN93877.1 transport protein [Lactobacillus phage LJ]
MSEEKLYAVKNDEDEWLDQDHLFGSGAWATPDKDEREKVAKCYGGHVVTLIEEPKKVVLTKEQAEIVENAHDSGYPATEIFSGTSSGAGEERLLINAYVNGYTVAKEKKYLLPMYGTLEENDDNDNFQLYAYCYKGRWLTDECETDPSYKHHTVTQKELEKAPEWVKAIKPVDVTDDEV